MLSNGFDTPLRLELKTSKILISFQLLVHLLAIVAISFPSSVPIFIKFVLFVFVAVSAVMLQRKYRYRLHHVELFVWQKNSLWIESGGDKQQVWECQPGNLVTPWFVVVRLCSENKKLSLLIVKDQCDAQSFRRLRVKLKYFQRVAVMPTDAS